MSVLQDAFREAARREFARIPSEEESNCGFSASFLKRMEELLSGQENQEENAREHDNRTVPIDG